MRNKLVFGGAVAGLIAGLVSATIYALPARAEKPAFQPASNPYRQGIYASGIIESDQSSGINRNLYPEVTGVVARVLAGEGDSLRKGEPLFQLDDTQQRALTEQQQAQAEAAKATLAELKAQPRPEALAVVKAQVAQARASLETARNAADKLEHAFRLDPRSVSADALDNARNAAAVALANLGVARRQYELTLAGAWVYQVEAQERQVEALDRASAASAALLGKFTVKAPADGRVMALNVAVGSYVSPQGIYDPYTQGVRPPAVFGPSTVQGSLAVRCYVDEILIRRLPSLDGLTATMFPRGSQTGIPLQFVRVQPYVSPKIQLSAERAERVDVRVLPVVFRFEPPDGVAVYPGELVDVYLGGAEATRGVAGATR